MYKCMFKHLICISFILQQNIVYMHFQKRFKIEKKVFILSIDLKKSFQQVFFMNTEASFA